MANRGDHNSKTPISKEHVQDVSPEHKNVETTPPMSSPTPTSSQTVEGGNGDTLMENQGGGATEGGAMEVDTGHVEAAPPSGDQNSSAEKQQGRRVEDSGLRAMQEIRRSSLAT
ncbi:hypothetical protein ACOSP7_022536 [Xanthoceras sorbifolium]